MKIISFSAVEILPALLSKKKTQTIRPAWKDVGYERVSASGNCEIQTIKRKMPRPPRYEVGEKVRLYWKQRSQYKMFCSKCGVGTIEWKRCSNGHKEIMFPKILEEAEITEVFEVEMIKGHKYLLHKVDKGITEREINNLAKRDGFKSAEEMFKWFDEHYNLTKPKRFFVYRWRWLK